MQLKDLSDEIIRELNKLEAMLCDVDIHTPSQMQLAKDKVDIEAVLRPKRGYITRPYARRVSIAYQYATTHHRGKDSMLSDIQNGTKAKDINISQYK